jgi:hypothetical protein
VKVNAIGPGGQTAACTQDVTLNSSGLGSCVISQIALAGNWIISAVFQENTTYITSTSDGKAHTVNKANTTTTITVPSSTIVVGQSFNVTASVAAVSPGNGTPTGSVSVTATKSGSSSVSCTITTLTTGSGSCSIALPASGTWTISGLYSGDVNFNVSSGSSDKNIGEASTTTTITNTSSIIFPNIVRVEFEVKVSSPGSGSPQGNVTVKGTTGQGANLKNETCVASASQGQCMLTLTATGTWKIIAVFDENNTDPNFSGSLSSEVTYIY